MSTASSDHKFQLSPPNAVNTADPNLQSTWDGLQQALGGGDDACQFFADNLNALQNLYETIATSGSSVWIEGEDENGNPVAYVENGKLFLTVGANIHDTDTVENGTGSTDNLKQVGAGYVNLTTTQGTSQQIVQVIEYGGLGIAGLAGGPLLVSLLKSLVKSIVTFVKNLAVKIFNGGTASDPAAAEDQVESDAGDAAEEASEAGVEIGEEVAVDIGMVVSGVGAVVAVGALAVVFIVALLEKQMYNYVKFYNATAIDVDFGICWLKSSTGAQTAPAPVGQTLCVPKISIPAAPPGVSTSQTAVYYSDLQFINNDLLEGIGYVLNANPSGDFPGFRVMVDIPNSGDNSLYVGFNTDDCEDVWNDEKNVNEGLTMNATAGNYTLSISTNQTSGESPSPVNAANGYNYEHLIVLSDGSADTEQG